MTDINNAIGAAVTEAQAVLELVSDRLNVDQPIEPNDAFTLFAAVQTAIGRLDAIHDALQAMLGGVNRDTLREWEKSGRLPPPIYLSPRVVGWRRSTLEAFIAECSAEGAGVR